MAGSTRHNQQHLLRLPAHFRVLRSVGRAVREALMCWPYYPLKGKADSLERGAGALKNAERDAGRADTNTYRSPQPSVELSSAARSSTGEPLTVSGRRRFDSCRAAPDKRTPLRRNWQHFYQPQTRRCWRVSWTRRNRRTSGNQRFSCDSGESTESGQAAGLLS